MKWWVQLEIKTLGTCCIAAGSVRLQREAVRFKLRPAVESYDTHLAALNSVKTGGCALVKDVHVVGVIASGDEPTSIPEVACCFDFRQFDGCSFTDLCGFGGGMEEEICETRISLTCSGESLLTYGSVVGSFAAFQLVMREERMFFVVVRDGY